MELHESDFDLAAMVRDVSAMFEAKCREKGLGFSVQNSAISNQLDASAMIVYGDEQKLRQVLINLLGNAVKFTERGEVGLKIVAADVRRLISITGVADKREDGIDQSLLTSAATKGFRFEVIDTGLGIAAEARDKIFEPFHQGAAGVKAGGTGLGLAIARRQLALMGGEIGVESELGRGTRFWITVPLGEGRRQNVEGRRPGSGSRLAVGFRVKALVVDDVQENRDVLSQMLSGIGCEVVLAESGERALELAAGAQPDIVFMDIRMPGIDGVETMRRMREEVRRLKAEGRRAKFVTLSASAFEQDRQRYLDAGFDDFIAKPFRFESVCECLARLLRVQFESGVESDKASATTTAPAAWTLRLPARLREQLCAAAADGNVTALGPLLNKVEQLGGEGSQLAGHLRDCARAYDLEKLATVLNALPHE